MINKKSQSGLRPFTVSILMVMLCAFFMILFISGFLTLTNPSSDVLQPKYGLSSSSNQLGSQINQINNLSQSIYSTMGGSDASPTDYLFLIFRGAFTIPYTFLKIIFDGIVTIGNVLFGAGTMLGSAFTISVSIILTVLTITLVLAIERAIRTGDSEH